MYSTDVDILILISFDSMAELRNEEIGRIQGWMDEYPV